MYGRIRTERYKEVLLLRLNRHLLFTFFLVGLLGGCESSQKEESFVLEMEDPVITETDIPSEKMQAHPFGVIKSSVLEDTLNVGRIDATGISFTEDEFITFYDQAVKDSDYDFVEIKISESTGIAFVGTHGLFGVNDVLYNEELQDFELPHYPNGYIQTDGTILYSTETFDDEDMASFVSSLIDYDLLSSFIEYGLFLVVNLTFVSDEAPVEMQVRQAVSAIMSQLLETPKFQTLMNVRLVFSSNPDAFTPSDESVGYLAISLDTLVSTDWAAFAKGEVHLSEDEFQVYK